MRLPLTTFRIAVRSLRFYWRTHVLVFLGATIASAVLVGGMLVGDSVKYSLRDFALLRLGDTEFAIQSRGRFFRADLANRLASQNDAKADSALIVPGVVIVDSGDEPVQVNQVQVIGVDKRFWEFTQAGEYSVTSETVAINQKLAAQLGIGEGAEVSIRVSKPSLLPRDAPLAGRDKRNTKRGRFTVDKIVPDEQLGRFSLSANQIAPSNVFVSIDWLQGALELPGRANTLLLSDCVDSDLDGLQKWWIGKAWQLGDVGLSIRERGGILQLESDRIFIDETTANRIPTVSTLAYLVNSISSGEKSTPYSFAIGVTPSEDETYSLVPPTMKDDQALINQWLATQLGVKVGDKVAVKYFELKPSGGFVEREREFTVFRIDSMDRFARERELMPEFPGLSDVQSCRDWDIGMPMDEKALEDPANEEYWNQYKATPKIIFTLDAARRMWSNRFGNTSTIRFATEVEHAKTLEANLKEKLDPATQGLFLVPVRQQAMDAVDEAMNFGELFLAMSFFLIVSALLLTGMLFVFGVQQRAAEMGTLLSLGWLPGQVRRLFIYEGGLIALLGSILGGFLGMGYTRALVWGLATQWRGAVSSAAIKYHVEPMTLVIGIISAFLCAMIAIIIAMWRQAGRPARELLTSAHGESTSPDKSRAKRFNALAALACGILSAATVGYGLVGSDDVRTYVFFGAGFFLLLFGLFCSRALLLRLATRAARRLTITAMGMRAAARRSGRSLAVIALLACGCFLVFAVSAMQQDLAAFAHERWSGTGGFALFAESTLPLPDPLETDKGRKQFGLDREELLENTSCVSIKVRDGDDASCFNLNRAQSPRLLGVDPKAFIYRKAFMGKSPTDNAPWDLLDMKLPAGVIPGLVGDGNTAMWNLQKKAHPKKGDEITYKDEQGREFRVKLVGKLPMPLSVFQGTILVSRSQFMERYPSEAGYRMFLVDVPEGTDRTEVRKTLNRRLERAGFEAGSTLTRITDFHEVEATYLNMFLILGGLGMVLGALGLGVVVMRNVLERRSELAILRCVGYTRIKVVRLVLAEHLLLLVLGLGLGLFSALLAILPILLSPGMHIPILTMVGLFVGIYFTGVMATTVASHLAMRGDLIPSLREE